MRTITMGLLASLCAASPSIADTLSIPVAIDAQNIHEDIEQIGAGCIVTIDLVTYRNDLTGVSMVSLAPGVSSFQETVIVQIPQLQTDGGAVPANLPYTCFILVKPIGSDNLLRVAGDADSDLARHYGGDEPYEDSDALAPLPLGYNGDPNAPTSGFAFLPQSASGDQLLSDDALVIAAPSTEDLLVVDFTVTVEHQGAPPNQGPNRWVVRRMDVGPDGNFAPSWSDRITELDGASEIITHSTRMGSRTDIAPGTWPSSLPPDEYMAFSFIVAEASNWAWPYDPHIVLAETPVYCWNVRYQRFEDSSACDVAP